MGIAIFLSNIIPVAAFIKAIIRFFLSFIKNTNISHTAAGVMVLVVTFSILYLAAHLFTKHMKYRDRLPTKIPGTYFILAGLLLYLFFKLALVLASMVDGGGTSFVVRQFSIFIILPSYFLIGLGIYKAYKSLAPVNS